MKESLSEHLEVRASESLRGLFAEHAEELLRGLQSLVDSEVRRLRQELEQERAALWAERCRVDEERSAVEARERALEEEKSLMQGLRLMDDVLQLNVGGKEVCAVRRATLCIAGESMLSSMFSGRWDDALTKDTDGRIFIDSTPELFMPLLDFLRQKCIEDPTDPVELPQVPCGRAPDFFRMVSYYGLRDLVSPLRKWEPEYGDCNLWEDGMTAGAKSQAGRWNCAAVLSNACRRGYNFVLEVTKTSEEKWYDDSFALAIRGSNTSSCRSAREMNMPAAFPTDSAPRDQATVQVEVVVRGGKLSMRMLHAEVSTTCAPGVTEQPYRLIVALTYPWIQVSLRSAEPILDAGDA